MTRLKKETMFDPMKNNKPNREERKMKRKYIASMLLAGIMTVSILSGCSRQPSAPQENVEDTQQDTSVDRSQEENTVSAEVDQASAPDEASSDALMIVKQGMFSSGGTVTEPVAGDYDPTSNWLDATRAGNTAHVDHANVFYQIPVNDNGNPIVYLHGYGQSRMGWMTTPDGREGWSDLFLNKGYAAFLVDQPRRGEAGTTASMTTDGFLDAWAEDSKDYKPGGQAWYTHFRIGRVAPERYEGSQFPEGDEAQNQFFRQMTPNTGNYDQELDAAALGAVMEDVYEMTGNKAIFVTHWAGMCRWIIFLRLLLLNREERPSRDQNSIRNCWKPVFPSQYTLGIILTMDRKILCPQDSGCPSVTGRFSLQKAIMQTVVTAQWFICLMRGLPETATLCFRR